MSEPVDMVVICGDDYANQGAVSADSNGFPYIPCSGSNSRELAPLASLSAQAWVEASADSTSCASSGQYYQITDIGAGYYVRANSDDSSSAVCLPAYQVTLSSPYPYTAPFSVTALDLTQLGEAFAAGLVIIATCMLLGWSVKVIVDRVR